MPFAGVSSPVDRRVALAAILVLIVPSAGAMQVEGESNRPAESSPPSASPTREPPNGRPGPRVLDTISFDTLRSAYRGAPIAERVTIAKRRGDVTLFDELTVRVHRDGEKRTLRIELPSLTIYAESRPADDNSRSDGTIAHEGRIVVVHNQNPAIAFVASIDEPITPALLRRHLRPIPAPAIDLAMGDATNGEFLASRVQAWRVDEGRPVLDLAGTPDAPDSQAMIDLDPATSRARTVTITPSSSDSGTARRRPDWTLDLRIDPIDPGEPASWAIDLSSREVVPSLAMLRPFPAPFPLAEPFPITTFQTANMLPWSVERALEPDPLPRRVQERYLALVVHALPDDPLERADSMQRTIAALTACERVRTHLAQRSLAPEGLGPRRALVRLRAHPVVCLEAPQARREIIREHERTLAVAPPPESPAELLWTGSPWSCLRRLHASAPVAIALLDEQTRLVRVIAINKGAPPDAIARDLEEAILREVNLLAPPAG